MADARAVRFEAVLVWKFDRFARSALHLLRALDEFGRLKIRFVSMTEGLDTGTPMGEAVLTILGALAKLERDAIAERVRMGQARARARGVRFGRPLRGFEKPREGARPKHVADPEEIARRRAAGQSWRAIARALRVPMSTVRRRMTACRKSPTEAELLNRYPVATVMGEDRCVTT
jgi:DNA invertase Pin-like site-specific DNA recombinase